MVCVDGVDVRGVCIALEIAVDDWLERAWFATACKRVDAKAGLGEAAAAAAAACG